MTEHNSGGSFVYEWENGMILGLMVHEVPYPLVGDRLDVMHVDQVNWCLKESLQ